MQRFTALARTNATRMYQMRQVRHGSGGTMYYSKRWADIVRAESNVSSAEDPPRGELHESHEAGEGQSDFSNWVSKHEDTSTMQVVGGLVFITGLLYGIHLISQNNKNSKPPKFALREIPSLENDIPTFNFPKH